VVPRGEGTAEERSALALEGAGDGVWDWELVEDALHLSARWKAQLGFADHELASAPETLFARLHPDDRPALRHALDAHLAGRTPRLAIELRLRARDGSYRHMLTRGVVERDATGVPVRLAGTQTDVTAYRETEARLRHDALHDPLTGLPNRTLFLDRLALALRRAQREPGPACAVLFLDLDRFKLVNDSLGHAAGDRLLRAAAGRLARAVRPGDTVARLGGDEFVVLLEGAQGAREAAGVAERIQRALAAPLVVEGRELRASASIGIAAATADATPEDVVRDADLAMYRAKAEGPGRQAGYDAGLRDAALARLDAEAALRRALDTGELTVHYQPVAAAADGRIAGVEALVRWPGGLAPRELLALAEDTGLILALGDWVLREACRAVAAWRARPGHAGLVLGVNVSARELADPELPTRVRAALAAAGLPPDALRLEVGERALTQDPEGVLAVLGRLRDEAGVAAQIDDFGAGAASLRTLHRFPGTAIKLDRSFLQDPDAEAVLRAVAGLARTLGLEVVAEGVETPAQRVRAQALGCGLVQGYAIAAPLPAEGAGRLLAESR